MEYGEQWRRHRRLMHPTFNPNAVLRLRPHLTKASRNLLNRFLDTPDHILGNLRHMAGETIMSITYGLETQPKDDPFIKTAEAGTEPLAIAAVPGAFLVDVFPILKYVPEWMPGASFQRKAREWRKLARAMIEVPFAATKRNLTAGISRPCFTSICLQEMEGGIKDEAYSEDVIQNVAATMYATGSDTTLSAIASCILGLLGRPDVVKRAHQELDRVIKPGHLPEFDDEKSLPYITAIVKECLRWRDVVPMGVPHMLTTDDEYKGYHIPAGSIVIANSWAMLHNEDIFPDPFVFNPDRFMKGDKLDERVQDPAYACWGFGRRICPGKHMAFSAIWIAVASLLTVYDIAKKVDKYRNIIEPTQEYLSAIVCMPKPFVGSITPRSKEAENLIRSVANQELF